MDSSLTLINVCHGPELISEQYIKEAHSLREKMKRDLFHLGNAVPCVIMYFIFFFSFIIEEVLALLF